MNWISHGIFLLSFGAYLASALGQNDSPTGKWKTFDDKTGRARSIVEITEKNGALSGRVLEVLESPQGPHPLCKPCRGERKDQPIEGMMILWGAKKNGASWEGGEILDPENGKIYHATLTVLGTGQKLRVRGYIGLYVIGRSQIWQRQEEQLSKQ